jgi:Family of unknown function (DUF5684)
MSGLLVIIWLAVIVFVYASLWIVYTKANQPGWACIIPIYNIWVLLKIVGRPGWWLIWFFIPIANVVVWFIVAFDLAHSFGQSTGFGVGVALLPIIFYPILAWGDATYEGPAAPGGSMGSPPPASYAPPAVPPPPAAPPPAAIN